jgi:hypothetical protein
MALWLIAREAAGQPADGPPRHRLKMGDILESCGAHGPVNLTRTNCLLAAALPDSRTPVKEFYGAAAQETKTDILNPICYPEEAIAHIPLAARKRSYGCGSLLDGGKAGAVWTWARRGVSASSPPGGRAGCQGGYAGRHAGSCRGERNGVA